MSSIQKRAIRLAQAFAAAGAIAIATPSFAAAQAVATAFTPTASQAALIERARAAGASDLTTRSAADGGMILNGKLDGRQFALAIPPGWTGDALLHAHGYTLPGSPLEVSTDPTSPLSGGAGIMAIAYRDGLAAGHSAYGKSGMAVEAGVVATLRLQAFVKALGARRVYVNGASMGGNIVMALIETRPDAFAGAIAQCGVTDGWERELGQLSDLRAAYNFLTAGTPYALPGVQDVTRSALPIAPPPGENGDLFRLKQAQQFTAPIVALFKAAKAAPEGREARIVRQIASIGGFEPELASFALPLTTLGFGADDMRETFGGQVYGNVGKVYRSLEMTPAEAEAFNRGVQRFAADPAAVAKARQWRQVTGRYRTPLVTIHNRIDSLAPYAHAESLTRIVAKAGNGARLIQFTAPAVEGPLPIGGKGYEHCGFNQDEIQNTWRTLRTWVETGRRPAVPE
ncbi:MAG: prolyl oligopeptidase family serine peptidase [Phenylobacterium sp.]|uniref:alpha/beta hydrolase family protein n=1 Tax=Phenylobacterium sp. TaxID=1871053 RepID=UPI0025D8FB76|nr:alpha/beta hydrolase [Phenylobacterium sp.]MBI1196977.1 prolyl oligopeptidase family serine peptidase [Phenylobacterium sp.]